ncbi:MAG: proteasome subunit beta, partial [Candidatus Micrarchaeota archaeon]
QRKRRITVEAAATILANILQNNKYFPYWVGLLLGGYDSEPRLYSLDGSGAMLPEDYASVGSGSTMAYGVLEDSYKKGISTKEGASIVARAVRAARERDVYTGGSGMDLALITKDGIKMISGPDAEALLK